VTTPPSPTPSLLSRLPRATRAGLVGLAVVSLLGLLSGLGGALVLAGLYVAATGVWSMVRGRSWLGRHARGASVAVLVGGLVLVGVGGAATPSTGEATPRAGTT